MLPRTIYLHGFASSPQSHKAQYFANRLPQLLVPDLNQGGFSGLTISRQLGQVQALLTGPSYIIGSSLGGLTAALLATRCPHLVKKLVLLAPAFELARSWQQRLGHEAIAHWQAQGSRNMFHYGEQKTLPLNFEFFTDAKRHEHLSIQTKVPTLIIHGRHDQIVPVQVSERYCQERPWTQLITLDSDHTLGNCIETIFALAHDFLFATQELS